MTHPLKAAALRYAAKSWPVFLLGRSKRPVANCAPCTTHDPGHDKQACPCLTCHGLYAATLDPKRIDAMFRLVPKPMLAIRTGAASGLVVIDIDPAHGGQTTLSTLVARGVCTPTALVRTGSGGTHLYYRHPGPSIKVGCSQSRLGPGADVRGDGGYVVAPPSVHPRTRAAYTWAGARTVAEMAPALVHACRPPAAVTAAPGPLSTARAGAISNPARLLTSLVASVRDSKPGTRRTTLYGASRGVARMVAAGAITANHGYAALMEIGLAVGQTAKSSRAAISGGFKDEGVPLP